MEFHGNLTLEKFYLDWFGNFARELGSNTPHQFGTCPKGYEKSHRMFTDNPKVYLDFINWCKTNQTACWITSQPMRSYGVPLGIEKIFFDFDYPLKKNQNMTNIKREKVKKQVLDFTRELEQEPFVVATRKGYHVYVFLRRIYEFNPRDKDFASDVFGVLGSTLIGMPKLYCQLNGDDRKYWKYLDFAPLGDMVRMARVPLTPHEKTGITCQILNRNLEPTKIRGLDFYRGYGLREYEVREAAEIVKKFYKKKIKKEQVRINSGIRTFNNGNKFQGQIRPCFTERLKTGEMKHQQRLAFLMEAYNSGFKTEEQILRLCRNFNDFNEKESLKQIRWFLKHKTGFPPYKCKTIESYGWCLKSECQIYKNHNTEKHTYN